VKNCGICRALFDKEVEATPEHMDVHTMRNRDPEAVGRQKEIVAKAQTYAEKYPEGRETEMDLALNRMMN